MKTTCQTIILSTLISLTILSCSAQEEILLVSDTVDTEYDISATEETAPEITTKLKKLTTQTTNERTYYLPDTTEEISLEAEIAIENDIIGDTTNVAIDSTEIVQIQENKTLIDKAPTKEKEKLNWLQKALIYIGIIILIIVLIRVGRYIYKKGSLDIDL